MILHFPQSRPVAGWWLLIICFSKTASGVYSSREQTVRQGKETSSQGGAKDKDNDKQSGTTPLQKGRKELLTQYVKFTWEGMEALPHDIKPLFACIIKRNFSEYKSYCWCHPTEFVSREVFGSKIMGRVQYSPRYFTCS